MKNQLTVTLTLLIIILSVSFETTNLTNGIHPFVHITLGFCYKIIYPARSSDTEHVLVFFFSIFKSQASINLMDFKLNN